MKYLVSGWFALLPCSFATLFSLTFLFTLNYRISFLCSRSSRGLCFFVILGLFIRGKKINWFVWRRKQKWVKNVLIFLNCVFVANFNCIFLCTSRCPNTKKVAYFDLPACPRNSISSNEPKNKQQSKWHVKHHFLYFFFIFNHLIHKETVATDTE